MEGRNLSRRGSGLQPAAALSPLLSSLSPRMGRRETAGKTSAWLEEEAGSGGCCSSALCPPSLMEEAEGNSSPLCLYQIRLTWVLGRHRSLSRLQFLGRVKLGESGQMSIPSLRNSSRPTSIALESVYSSPRTGFVGFIWPQGKNLNICLHLVSTGRTEMLPVETDRLYMA